MLWDTGRRENMIFTGLLFTILRVFSCYAMTCGKGEYLHPLKYVCQRCTPCMPGYHVQASCEGMDNTLCLPCPNNTFLNATSISKNVCRNCTQCDEYTTQCKATADAVCLKETDSNEKSFGRHHTLLAVLLALSFVGIVICGGILLLRWRKRSRSPTDSLDFEAMRNSNSEVSSKDYSQPIEAEVACANSKKENNLKSN